MKKLIDMGAYLKAPEARKLIGEIVAWDDISKRYHFIRCGKLTEVQGKNAIINGDYKWLPNLLNLRKASEQDLKHCY